jgi:hypothetical protein
MTGGLLTKYIDSCMRKYSKQYRFIKRDRRDVLYRAFKGLKNNVPKANNMWRRLIYNLQNNYKYSTIMDKFNTLKQRANTISKTLLFKHLILNTAMENYMINKESVFNEQIQNAMIDVYNKRKNIMTQGNSTVKHMNISIKTVRPTINNITQTYRLIEPITAYEMYRNTYLTVVLYGVPDIKELYIKE